MKYTNLEGIEEGIFLSKKMDKYISQWKWFIVSILLMLFSTVISLRYATHIYSTSAKILIKDPNNSNSINEFAAFSDFVPTSAGGNIISDELDIFESKKIISKVVEKLHLNVEQFREGNIKTTEIYKELPLSISFRLKDKKEKVKARSVKINLLSADSYELINDDGEKTKGNFNVPLDYNEGLLIINKSIFYTPESLTDLRINIHSVKQYTSKIQKLIGVNLKDKRSNIVSLSVQMSTPNKAEDIINSLINEYNLQAVEEENLVAKNTSSFIAERLQIIKKELDVVEIDKVAFKKGNNLTDLTSDAQLFIEQSGESQSKLFDVEIQLELIESMIEYLEKEQSNYSLLPVNIGINSPELNTLMGSYNTLVFEKNSLLESSTELNPSVVKLTNEIKSQREILIGSLKNQKNNQRIIKNDIKRQTNKIKGKIASIPQQEKDYRVIERQQNVKEALYLFLLQKREETSLSMARTLPKAKIIDEAFTSEAPISPKPKFLLLSSLLLGLMIPSSFIFLKNYFNTKVKDKLDIESLASSIPMLGELPRIKKGEKGILTINDRTVLGESFRLLRANLNYFLKIKKEEDKALRIFVTSTIKGEGKTFVAFNSALTIAETSKRVLVIGADVRNPQIHRYLNLGKKTEGLSEYLYDNEIELKDVLNSITINENNIDFILSGRIPPNPSELLINGRFEKLLAEVEGIYDYVIVDTAPTMLVSDTLTVCDSADVMMYVVRAGYTDKNLLNYITKLVNEGKIKNVALVLNDIKESNLGYGYSYGYGENSEKSFWKKLFRKA